MLQLSRRILLLMLLMPVMALAETGTIIRTTQMIDNPRAGAQPLATLYGEAEVEILQREGGWYQVRNSADGRIGWVRLTTVRLGKQAVEENESGFWGSLFSFTGRSSSRTATATTGIRGLDEADISNAVPDQRAVYELDRYASSSDDADRFARELGLQTQRVEHLPEDAK